MKIFERTSEEGWGNRLNIIDENNVFVGFDFDQSCCEDFGFYLTRDLCNPCLIEKESFDHSGYVFDVSFCKDLSKCISHDSFDDECGAIAFRLTKPDLPDLFVVLYNHHNGYYSHGFDMVAGDKNETIHSGSI